MRILSRYFLAAYLSLFIAILLTSMVAIAIIELLLNFDDVMGDHQGFSEVARYLFVRIPSYYFRDLIPVTSFAAAFFCVGLAARRQEIIAVKSGGVSPRRVVVPVLAAALALSALSLVLNDTIVRTTVREWNRREDPGSEVSFRQGSFWYHHGHTIYSVTEADRDTNTLRGVRVFEMGPRGRLNESIVAEIVEVDSDHRWHLRDATIRSFEPARPTAPPRVRFSQETVLTVAAERDLALLDAGASTLSLAELVEYIRARAADGSDVDRYKGLLHTRLADSLAVLVFAFIAIPVGLSVEQSRSLARGAVVAIIVLGVYYSVRTAAAMVAGGGLVSPILAPWWPLGGLAVLAGFQMLRRDR